MDYKNSLNCFEKALEIWPDKYEIYLNIAETYRIMGDKISSAEYLRLSEKYKPENK